MRRAALNRVDPESRFCDSAGHTDQGKRHGKSRNREGVPGGLARRVPAFLPPCAAIDRCGCAVRRAAVPGAGAGQLSPDRPFRLDCRRRRHRQLDGRDPAPGWQSVRCSCSALRRRCCCRCSTLSPASCGAMRMTRRRRMARAGGARWACWCSRWRCWRRVLSLSFTAPGGSLPASLGGSDRPAGQGPGRSARRAAARSGARLDHPGPGPRVAWPARLC